MKAERNLELVPLTKGLYLIGGKVYETVTSVNPSVLISQIPQKFYCVPFDTLNETRVLTGYTEYGNSRDGKYLLEAVLDMKQSRITHAYIRRQTPFTKLAKEINSFITESQQPVVVPNLTLGGKEVKMVCRIRRCKTKRGEPAVKFESIFITGDNYVCFDRSISQLAEFIGTCKFACGNITEGVFGSEYRDMIASSFKKDYLQYKDPDVYHTDVADSISAYATVRKDEMEALVRYVLDTCCTNVDKVVEKLSDLIGDNFNYSGDNANQIIITQLFG